MSSSAFEPQGSPGDNENLQQQQSAMDDSCSQSQQNSQRELFEQVMRETQGICAEGSAIDSTAEKAILCVARKHRDQTFSLDPVLRDLVNAVLCSRLSQQADMAGVWHDISGRVAEMLFQDPMASQRLERFWRRLMNSPLVVGDGQ